MSLSTETPRTVITFGTYDLFHFGHLRILERSAERGTRLVVGVSSDKLNFSKKQVYPAINEDQRMAIVRSLKCVDHVFLEESLELKKFYCEKYNADVLVMGDDHLNEYNEMLEGTCDCEYLPRTDGVSSTAIKRQISSSDSLASQDSEYMPSTEISPSASSGCLNRGQFGADTSADLEKIAAKLLSIPEKCKDATPSEDAAAVTAAYSATNQNLVRTTVQSNPVSAYLVDVHDAYYNWICKVFTPVCRKCPREVTVAGRTLTVFSANIVTYGRGLLAIAIALSMKYNYLAMAAFLVMFHDFLDHLDGVVAKQQAIDGLNKGDDPRFGAYLDAQMDKAVFCLCLWSFLLFVDYGASNAAVSTVVTLTCAVLFSLECTIATVRVTDYFTAKLAPPEQLASGKKPALRSVSEGKLKQKFESVGIAFYCLALPDPSAAILATLAGTICLWFAAHFSVQSLMHKLRAREELEKSA